MMLGRQCGSDFYGTYSSLQLAIASCTADLLCAGVFDPSCDGAPPFALCMDDAGSDQLRPPEGHHCVFEKARPPPPPPLPAIPASPASPPSTPFPPNGPLGGDPDIWPHLVWVAIGAGVGAVLCGGFLSDAATRESMEPRRCR